MNYPPIASFPNDQQLRVVWGFGSVHVRNNLSTAPHFLVSLRSIVDNRLDDYETVYRIPLAQADMVRLGTIWLGQRRIEGFWKQYSKPYERSVVFDFDFFDIPPTSMEFSEKDPSTDHYQIPPFAYPLAFGTKSKINTKLKNIKSLNEDEKKYLKRQDVYLGQITRSKLTKLISTNECTVLIPSIEFLTSCYTPREQQLRNKIINLKLDDALADYIDLDQSGENDLGEYDLYMKSRKHQTNLAFLGYAHCNAVTKKRLEALRTSLNKANKDRSGRNYPDRYPDVLPYHPDGMSLDCDGISIDDQTFLVLRVNGCSLPTKHKINQILMKTVYTGKENDPMVGAEENNLGGFAVGGALGEFQNVPIVSGLDPNVNTLGAYVTTEVMILGSLPNIEDFEETKESDIKRKKNNKFEGKKPKSLSSGDLNSSNYSEGVGQLKQSESDLDSTEYVNQLEIVETVNVALQALLSREEIKELKHLDSFANNSSSNFFGSFPSKLIGHKDSHNWALYFKDKDNRVITRAFLLVEITLLDGKVVFLFEIQRKNSGEGFSGLIFETNDDSISSAQLYVFLAKIIEYKGKFRRRIKDSSIFKENGNLITSERNELPNFIKDSVLFDHRKGSRSWEEKMLYELVGYSSKV